MSDLSSPSRPDRTVDHEMEEQRLLSEIKALYARFHAGDLKPIDLVGPDRESPREWMATAIQNRADHQPDASVFRHFRREQGTILDIGAHWGYTALAMRLTGTDCPIASIEASVTNRANLDALRSWDAQYDFLIQALGDSKSSHALYTPVVNGIYISGLTNIDGDIFNDHHARHLASIIGTYIPYSAEYNVQLSRVEIATDTLDAVLQSHRFRIPTEKIAAIKLDVEHHELQVLAGARQTLRSRPFLMIEGGNRSASIARVLGEEGYVYADRDGDRVRLNDAMSPEVNGYWLHRERLAEYRQMGLLAD